MFILCEIKDLDVLCRSGFLYELGDLQQILIGYSKIIELPAKVSSYRVLLVKLISRGFLLLRFFASITTPFLENM